jgi:DtxR family Mn-dependent transcriptional regulator
MPSPLLSLIIFGVIAAVAALLFWPESGLFWRWQRGRSVTERILQEDALKHIHQCEVNGDRPTIKSLAGALNIGPNQVSRVLGSLQEHDLLVMEGDAFRLTPAGREYALRIIRAHRLYERYLADESGYAEFEWHTQAERQEHFLSDEDAAALAVRLGNPAYDPHGDPIPTADGQIAYAENRIPLTALEVDRPARIVHMEDEPETVYAQLVAEGLLVGQTVRLMEVSPQRVRFWAGGDEHILAPLVAANISVVPLPEEPPQVEEPEGVPLSSLQAGEESRVLKLSPRLRGVERRRLMDLGILPGTKIRAELVATGGDPVAYRIRGALIALRREQSDLIWVEKVEG